MRVSLSTAESANMVFEIDLWMKWGCGTFGWLPFVSTMFAAGIAVLWSIGCRQGSFSASILANWFLKNK
jgi:hypothetical protein